MKLLDKSFGKQKERAIIINGNQLKFIQDNINLEALFFFLIANVNKIIASELTTI